MYKWGFYPRRRIEVATVCSVGWTLNSFIATRAKRTNGPKAPVDFFCAPEGSLRN